MEKGLSGPFLVGYYIIVCYIELTNKINNTMNKYEMWYASITKRGQNRIIDSYTESHHIIPRSLGGPDIPSNITKLSAREHFICHWLLTKIYKDGEEHWKMVNALRIMRAENKNQQRYENKITARVYSNLKEEYSRLQSERMKGPGNPMYGKQVSVEVKKGRSIRAKNDNSAKRPGVGKKISDAKTGIKREAFSDEWRSKMSSAKLGKNNHRYGIEVSEETRKKIGAKLKGRKQSEEEKLTRSKANIGKKREKKQCPHCQKMVAVNGYARWHADNCKNKETQMNKLPTWNNRNLNENSTPITDKELADKIKLHHSSCQEAIKMIESFLNENK